MELSRMQKYLLLRKETPSLFPRLFLVYAMVYYYEVNVWFKPIIYYQQFSVLTVLLGLISTYQTPSIVFQLQRFGLAVANLPGVDDHHDISCLGFSKYTYFLSSVTILFRNDFFNLASRSFFRRFQRGQVRLDQV